jgi:hypothetical protein
MSCLGMGSKLRNTNVTDGQVIAAYEALRSAYKVAEALGIGNTTVYRILLKNGISREGLHEYRKRSTRFQGQEQQIRDWYESGDTLDQIRIKLGGASDYSIKHAIRRAGGSLRINPAPTEKPGEAERVRALSASGLGQVAISLTIGRSQSFVGRLMRRHGIPTNGGSGPAHSQWKGGRYINPSGYVEVWIGQDDPMACMARNTSYVLEHRLAMARHLGRPLQSRETVHHINGDHTDNRIENLQLRQGRHGNGVVMCCLDCGSHRIGPSQIKEKT